MSRIIAFTISLIFVACTSSSKAPADYGVENQGPAQFTVRVQSSYGDIEEVKVKVKEWLFDGQDVRVFEERTTPFDIPFAAGDFSVWLLSSQGAPKIRLQLLNAEGERIGYVQSSAVCAQGFADGSFGVKDCMVGLR